MALALGTNCGFVTEAPAGDPEGSVFACDAKSQALDDVSPAGAVRVTEIGWYCDNATEAADFDVGIYTDEGGDIPVTVVGSLSKNNAKGTGAGWKSVVGLNILISAETKYWLAWQCDNTSTTTNLNYKSEAGSKWHFNDEEGAAALEDPTWTIDSSYGGNLIGIYAVTAEAAPEGAAGIMTTCGGYWGATY